MKTLNKRKYYFHAIQSNARVSKKVAMTSIQCHKRKLFYIMIYIVESFNVSNFQCFKYWHDMVSDVLLNVSRRHYYKTSSRTRQIRPG